MQDYSRQITVVMLAIGLLVLNFFFASRGIDLSDQGYLLAMQDTSQDPRYLPIWASVKFVEILSWIFGDWSYFASRYFAHSIPLLILLTFILGLKTQIKFEKHLIVGLLFISVWAGRSVLSEWTYYSTLSGLLVSIAIIIFSYSFKNRNYISYFLANFLLLIAIAFKISNLVFLILPFVYLLLMQYADFTKQQKNKIYSSTLLLPALILVAIFASSGSHINTYIQQGITEFLDYTNTSEVHNSANLISKTWQDLTSYSLISLLFCGFLFLQKLALQIPLTFRLLPQLTLLSVFIWLQYYYAFFEWNSLFPLYALILIWLAYRTNCHANRFLIISSFTFLLLSSVGSGNALKASFIAEPLCCFIILSFSYHLDYFKKHRKTLAFSVFLLVFLGIQNKTLLTYRDSNKLLLSYYTQTPALKGMQTTQEKALLINELYNVRLRYPNHKDALIYPTAPLLHTALSLKPFIANPWPNLYSEKVLQKKLIGATNFPDIVIRLHKNPRKKDWPLNNQPIERDQNYQSIKYMDQWVKEKDYIIAENNQYYTLYVKK